VKVGVGMLVSVGITAVFGIEVGADVSVGAVVGGLVGEGPNVGVA